MWPNQSVGCGCLIPCTHSSIVTQPIRLTDPPSFSSQLVHRLALKFLFVRYRAVGFVKHISSLRYVEWKHGLSRLGMANKVVSSNLPECVLIQFTVQLYFGETRTSLDTIAVPRRTDVVSEVALDIRAGTPPYTENYPSRAPSPTEITSDSARPHFQCVIFQFVTLATQPSTLSPGNATSERDDERHTTKSKVFRIKGIDLSRSQATHLFDLDRLLACIAHPGQPSFHASFANVQDLWLVVPNLDRCRRRSSESIS